VSWLLDADILSQPAKRHGEGDVQCFQAGWFHGRCFVHGLIV